MRFCLGVVELNEKIWSYRCVSPGASWRRIDSPVVYEDGVGVEDAIKAAGFEPFDGFGEDFLGASTSIFGVWSRSEGRPHADYLVVWSPNGDRWEEFHVEDLPSLLSLYQLLTPIASQRSSQEVGELLGKVLNRAFEAWHGHQLDQVCRECDVDEHQNRLRMREHRRERERLAKDTAKGV